MIQLENWISFLLAPSVVEEAEDLPADFDYEGAYRALDKITKRKLLSVEEEFFSGYGKDAVHSTHLCLVGKVVLKDGSEVFTGNIRTPLDTGEPV